MYKILLDDRFYKNSIHQNEYLKKTLKIIQNYFNAKIVYFTPFNQKINSYHIAQHSQLIHKQILQTKKAEKYNLTNVNPQTNDLLKRFGFDENFIGKIMFIINDNPQNIVIIPLIYDKSHRELHSKKCLDKIYFVGNLDEEVESKILNNRPDERCMNFIKLFNIQIEK